jgi:hypothetical protein
MGEAINAYTYAGNLIARKNIFYIGVKIGLPH